MPANPHDPPAPRHDPLVGDAEREAALERLREASVDGRLTVDELAGRAGLVHGARTAADLRAVTGDLGPVTAIRLAAAAADRSAAPGPPAEVHRTRLGRARHAGRRPLAARSRFAVTLGIVRLDLRDVVLSGPRADIELHPVLGWFQLIVPEGVEVRLEGDGVLTNREVHLRAVPVPPGAPVVVLHVSGFLGSVVVRSRPRR